MPSGALRLSRSLARDLTPVAGSAYARAEPEVARAAAPDKKIRLYRYMSDHLRVKKKEFACSEACQDA